MPLCLVLALVGCKSPKKDDRALAKVGSRSVMMAEYQAALKRLIPDEGAVGKQETLELKKDLLSQMIEEELILEEAAKRAIDVSDGELKAEVDKIRSEYGDKSFKDEVGQRYASMDEWREEVRKKLIIKKTINDAVGKAAGIDENSARSYYEAHIKDYDVPEQVRARQIVVSSEEEARSLRSRITPQNFASIAKEVSLSPDAKKGGDLGYFARGDMPGEFEEAVFDLKPGEISPVVKTEYGFHIFVLEAKRKGGRLKFAEVKDRITQRLRGDRADEEVAAWIASLKKKAVIELNEELL